MSMKPGEENTMKVLGKHWMKSVKKQWLKFLRLPEKENPMMLSEEIMMMFPEDLLMEILLRLPIKSLLRLSCVCKAWHNLIIKNPYFAERHLNDGMNNNKEDDPTLAIIHGARFNESLLSHRDIHKPLPVISRLSYLPGVNWHLASCNGILCSASTYGDFIHLFNPITQERPLRLPPFNGADHDPYENAGLGFGFDAFGKDYKVVRIARSDGNNHAQIYRSSTNSWSQLDVNLKRYARFRNGVFAKGFYYWQTYYNLRSNIVKFEFENEMFGEIECPEGVYRCMSVVDGSLAVCTSSLNQMSVWIMRENGPWMKRFYVALPSNISAVVTFWVHNMDLVMVGYDERKDKTLVASFPNERECKILSQFSRMFYYSCKINYVHVPPNGCICRPTLVSLPRRE